MSVPQAAATHPKGATPPEPDHAVDPAPDYFLMGTVTPRVNLIVRFFLQNIAFLSTSSYTRLFFAGASNLQTRDDGAF
jgi:hypothetical protein